LANEDYQAEKKLVLEYYRSLDAASIDDLAYIQENYVADRYLWRGFHPFHEIENRAKVAEKFWVPLRTALTSLQRRMDIFMAGQNAVLGQGGIWVVSMGHLLGLFDNPWLGIPPTGKIAMLRYCEFHRVENGKITETAMFFDIPHLMMQAGLTPFPSQTAAHLVQPGPVTHEGLMFKQQDIADGHKTLAAIKYMIDDIKTWKSDDDDEPLVEELRRSWNEDMIWWGPTGIGATYTIERYAKQHSGPFRETMSDRKFNGHICQVAEGHFGGFFGWPNLTLTPSGGFMGMPPSNKPGDMRVIDMYRRVGNKLTENWIFIDLLHFWNMQGIDVLAQSTGQDGTPQ